MSDDIETPSDETPSDETPSDQVEIVELDYADAIGELEDILTRLESTNVDVDELTQQVRRAAVLIGHCRSRLHIVERDVHTVLNELGRLAADPVRSPDGEAT